MEQQEEDRAKQIKIEKWIYTLDDLMAEMIVDNQKGKILFWDSNIPRQLQRVINQLEDLQQKHEIEDEKN